jgi:uncharacterized protein (TIGR02453 family)
MPFLIKLAVLKKKHMQHILNFLKDLQANNNREWFQENKNRYKEVQDRFESYVMLLAAKLHEIDPRVNIDNPKDCTFRIYRDIRFSKNKQPYKDHIGAYIAPGGRKSPFAGYYLHISPGSCFAGGGLYRPEPKILKAVRAEIYTDPEELKSILNTPEFKETFGEIMGERLKTAPQGYPKDWPDIELLRPKSYAVSHALSEEEITSPKLFNTLENIYKTLFPLNEYLNRIVEKMNKSL